MEENVEEKGTKKVGGRDGTYWKRQTRERRMKTKNEKQGKEVGDED